MQTFVSRITQCEIKYIFAFISIKIVTQNASRDMLNFYYQKNIAKNALSNFNLKITICKNMRD